MTKKPKYKKLSRLKGLMKQYEITVEAMSKAIGRCTSTISKANNGHNLYDAMDMQNIKKLINSKAEKNGKTYMIDEIFYDNHAFNTLLLTPNLHHLLK